MDTERALTTSWSAILRVFARVVDLDATAKEYKAFQRPRKITSAQDLLRLALAFGAGIDSYRSLSAWALVVGLGNLSDVAIIQRLRCSSEWLVFLAGRLLSSLFIPDSSIRVDRPIRIIDASCISKPGSKGTDFRLHGVFDPNRQTFTQLELTDVKGGERISRFSIKKGEIWLADRGYIAVHGLRHVLNAGADIIVRIGWRAMRLFHIGGDRFELIKALRTAGDRLDLNLEVEDVKNGGSRVPVRLVAMRKSPQNAEKERRRVRSDAKRKGKQPTAETLEAADWIILITTLPESEFSADSILQIYRIRWQIEIGFKRLKSINLLDRLKARDDALGRSWIAANLILAILISYQCQDFLDSPPCAACQA